MRLWTALVLAGAQGCTESPPPQLMPVPALAAGDVITSLYLIGDAGKPNPAGEPVLQALRRDLASRPSQRVVVYLGDNVYPRGLPAPNQPGRRAAELSLTAQVEAITATASQGYFVPGNHDWAKHGADGWEAIKRQEAFIDSVSGGKVSLEPGGGCPGPAVIDVGVRLRLLLMDSNWWLHGGPKPQHPTSDCPTDAESEIVDSMQSALIGAPERMVVVAQHHPLMSGGIHGGYFGWRDHLFPLRTLRPSLWIPLPLLGSLYPTARQDGISIQDIGSRGYQRLIAAFRRAFAAAPPALSAAGHEHNLQVIDGGRAGFHLVSGTGIYGHTGRAVAIRGTLFARNASGFARLDIPRQGRARLAVLEVNATGQSHEVFSTWVE